MKVKFKIWVRGNGNITPIQHYCTIKNPKINETIYDENWLSEKFNNKESKSQRQ